MKGTSHFWGGRFRVWIARYQRWRPRDCQDAPPTAVAVEPAEQGTMSGEEAAGYVEAFNRVALGRSGNLWAVALPVKVCYQGEPRPGEIIEVRHRRVPASRADKRRSPRACQAWTRDGPPPRARA